MSNKTSIPQIVIAGTLQTYGTSIPKIAIRTSDTVQTSGLTGNFFTGSTKYNTTLAVIQMDNTSSNRSVSSAQDDWLLFHRGGKEVCIYWVGNAGTPSYYSSQPDVTTTINSWIHASDSTSFVEYKNGLSYLRGNITGTIADPNEVSLNGPHAGRYAREVSNLSYGELIILKTKLADANVATAYSNQKLYFGTE